jgi:sulfatase modifying factor 1
VRRITLALVVWLIPSGAAIAACSDASDPDSALDGADASAGAVDGAAKAPPASPDASPTTSDAGADAACPPEMAHIDAFCIDRWEAYVVEVDDAGAESPHSPYEVIGGAAIRAKSAPDVVPQGYISQVEASGACARAGKRLCAATEFALACSGVPRDVELDGGPFYPYGGRTYQPGVCNEGKGSTVARFFGPDPNAWTYADFNDPILNEWDGGLAKTGAYAGCVSTHGVYDCVGNLHEWGADPADVNGHGRFRGGFYGDAEINGHGCLYVTSAHELTYHDYSTGFRCCRDAQ